MAQNDKKELSVWDLRLMVAAVGLALFLVFFVLSMAAGCAWAEHYQRGDGQAVLAAVFPAFIIAMILTIISCVYMAKRFGKEENNDKK